LLLDVLAAVGRGSLALGRLYEGHVNALLLVQAFGTPRQADEAGVAARIEGRLFGVWNSEDAQPGAGVRIQTDGDRSVLTGAKTFASGAGHVTRALVTATLPDDRRQMCLVPWTASPPA
jgi:alkylation response protein AidB-like acyl-CoA dehydrogenase